MLTICLAWLSYWGKPMDQVPRNDFVQQCLTEADYPKVYYNPNKCGIVSLCAICKHFGINSSLEEVMKACNFNNQPINLKQLCEASAKLGLEAKAYNSNSSHLEKLGGPAIIDYPKGHFCVFLGWKGNSIRLLNPSQPIEEITIQELDKKWGRHIVLFNE